MFCRFAPMIGLLAACGVALWAAPAYAQVNIDQGKSAAEIFSNDCGTCHKTAKGLGNGKNSATLAGFLREHYTSSAAQANSLAAYVLGAGSGPPPSANLKPASERAKAAAEEPKSGEPKSGEPKNGEAKSAGHPGRPEAPSAEEAPAAALSPAVPGRKPPAGRRDTRPVTASRGPRQEPETPPQAAPNPEPVAPVATAPAAPPATTEPANSEAPATAALPPTAPAATSSDSAPSVAPEASPAPSAAMSTPEAGSSTSAAAPAETPASDSAPVPRDDIPD